MNKKGLGIVIIIFGIYLVIGNTLGSVLFNYAGPIGLAAPISPSNYWRNWWASFGLLTVLVAITGLIMIIGGVRILLRNNKRTLLIAESE